MKLTTAEKFGVLGVETRVGIIELLKKNGKLGSKSISEHFGISTAAISQHLKVLKQAGLVTCQRDGYHIPYSLNEEVLDECRRVFSKVCSCSYSLTFSRVNKEDLYEASKECLLKYKRELKAEIKAVENRLSSLKTAQ